MSCVNALFLSERLFTVSWHRAVCYRHRHTVCALNCVHRTAVWERFDAATVAVCCCGVVKTM